jgi:hypothetical protein
VGGWVGWWVVCVCGWVGVCNLVCQRARVSEREGGREGERESERERQRERKRGKRERKGENPTTNHIVPQEQRETGLVQLTNAIAPQEHRETHKHSTHTFHYIL